MTTLLTTMLLLLPGAVADGVFNVPATAETAVRTQSIWAQDVTAELSRAVNAQPVRYAARATQDRARVDVTRAQQRTSDGASKASRKGAAAQEKAPVSGKLPGDATVQRNPSLEEVFERARSVWGNEDRMMEMLSGIVYTAKEARRDGIEPKPHVSSLSALRSAETAATEALRRGQAERARTR